jgi:hypothetical protein
MTGVQSISMVMVGLLLGWGLGAAAMKGALASRSQLLLKQALLQAQQRFDAHLSRQIRPE